MALVRQEWRSFWLGFGIGMFVLITGLGLLKVDYEGRKLSFGDDTPVAEVERTAYSTELKVKAFGRKGTWDVTGLDRAWEFICDFGCIPHE